MNYITFVFVSPNLIAHANTNVMCKSSDICDRHRVFKINYNYMDSVIRVKTFGTTLCVAKFFAAFFNKLSTTINNKISQCNNNSFSILP